MLGEMGDAASLVQLLRQTIDNERVLGAIAVLPRERFVAALDRNRAYDNIALPIACQQTISQPMVVARMLELLDLRPSDRVLDIGTGSGYHAALLAMLAGHVWTIERHRELSARAERTVRGLELENVTFVVGDGTVGLAAQAPFDAINVAAATDESVRAALEEQLAPGGRLVAPVGATDQRLTLARRSPTGVRHSTLDPVRFVPLVPEA